METILIINTIGLALLLVLVTAIIVNYFIQVNGYKNEIKMLKQDKKDLQELNSYYVKTFKEKAQDKTTKGFSLREKENKL